MRILITGKPGVGKTTLIKKLIGYFRQKGINYTGFYTEEIREGGVRKGFRLITHTGRELILAHVNIKSPFRVGKYYIDIDSFESLLNQEFNLEKTGETIYIIDEIGKMELFSRKFKELIMKILKERYPMIATVTISPLPFVKKIKRMEGVELITITLENRNTISDILKQKVERFFK